MKANDWIKLLCITALWGLNFSFIKLGVAHVEPLTLAGLRFLLCALPLALWVPPPSLQWRWIAGYGLSFGVGTWGLMTMALRAGLSPGIAAWLLQSSAFMTPLLALLWLREPMSAAQRRGMALASLGFFLVLVFTKGSRTWGLALALAAAFSLSVANVLLRRVKLPPNEVVKLMVWASPFAALPLLGAALAQHGPAALSALPAQLAAPQAWGSLLFQVYPVTLMGYAVWNRLLLKHGAAQVAPAALTVPLWAVAWGALLFGLWPSAGQTLGMAVIAAGLLVGNGLLPPGLWPGRRPV